MDKCAHQELTDIVRELLVSGHKPGVMLAFRLDAAGGVVLEIHTGGGISSVDLVVTALEMALGTYATPAPEPVVAPEELPTVNTGRGGVMGGARLRVVNP